MLITATVVGISRRTAYPSAVGTEGSKTLSIDLQQADGNSVYINLPDQLLPDEFAFGATVLIDVKLA